MTFVILSEAKDLRETQAQAGSTGRRVAPGLPFVSLPATNRAVTNAYRVVTSLVIGFVGPAKEVALRASGALRRRLCTRESESVAGQRIGKPEI